MVALEMGILSREWWETGQASRTPQEKKKRWKGKKEQYKRLPLPGMFSCSSRRFGNSVGGCRF